MRTENRDWSILDTIQTKRKDIRVEIFKRRPLHSFRDFGGRNLYENVRQINVSFGDVQIIQSFFVENKNLNVLKRIVSDSNFAVLYLRSEDTGLQQLASLKIHLTFSDKKFSIRDYEKESSALIKKIKAGR